MSSSHLFIINNVVNVFLVVFIILFIMLAVTIFDNFKKKKKSNNSRITRKAKIVAKRTSLYSAMKLNQHGIYHTSPEDSRYYITFKLQGGRREELKVPGRQYSIMVVGDNGLLVTEGTRFVEFRKER